MEPPVCPLLLQQIDVKFKSNLLALDFSVRIFFFHACTEWMKLSSSIVFRLDETAGRHLDHLKISSFLDMFGFRETCSVAMILQKKRKKTKLCQLRKRLKLTKKN